MFPIYPYINVNDLNLDYLLRTVKELETTIKNFVNFNAIKYADPLEWNITTQYQGNTVVIDNINHIAYLSTQPVPAGVLLTNTDYWTPILDLRSFYDSIGDLSELDTTAKDTLVNAINEVFTSLQEQIDTRAYVTPEMFGAVGDGVTDDTEAVKEAFLYDYVILNGTYLVTADLDDVPFHHTLTAHANQIIDGVGTLKLNPNNYANYDVIYIPVGADNVTVKNITIYGDSLQHLGVTGEWGFGINIDGGNDVLIDHVTIDNCWGDGILIGNLDHGQGVHSGNNNVIISNCDVKNNGRNNISICHGSDIKISKCRITGAYRTAPKAGIDIEPDNDLVLPLREIVNGCVIDSCYFNDNDGVAISINSITVPTDDIDGIIISNNNIDQDKGITGFTVSGLSRDNIPLIVGNKFNNVRTFAIGSAQIFHASIVNNSFEGENATDCITIDGFVGCAISGNVFTGTYSGAIIKAGTFAVVSDNKFTAVVGPTSDSIIRITGTNAVVLNNVGSFVNNPRAFVYIAHPVIVKGNVTRGNSVVFFIDAPTDYVSGNEAIFDNDFYFVNGVWTLGGSPNYHSNYINGTYTP